MDQRDRYDDNVLEEWDFESDEPGAGLMSALLMALALAILLASFVWFVIRLDPLTDDFIGGDPPVATPTASPEGP